ncbi:hypothetical protein FS749_002576 [Ceratobasidium sp. UAMH 11750]|nr:hypothetical protein FS749_002576 [Ceratobasidium sp. UAMH 11750]
MPNWTFLRLRAAQKRLSMAIDIPVVPSITGPTSSAIIEPSSSTQKSVRIQRCEFCLRILPLDSTPQRHVAATPECRAAEQAKLQTRWRRREAQRQAKEELAKLAKSLASKRAEAPTGSEPETQEEGEPDEPAAKGGNRAPKRRKVAQEAVPGEEAPVAVEQPAPVQPSPTTPPVAQTPPATPPISQTPPALSTDTDPEPRQARRTGYNVTVETVLDEEAPTILQPSAAAAQPIPSRPPVAQTLPRLRTSTDPINTVPDEGVSTIIQPSPATPPSPSEPPVVEGSSTRIGSKTRPARSVNARRRVRRRAGETLRRWKGLYVEDFPDPLAGAPISEDRAPELDKDAYMQSCGALANPKHFEIADLLTTTGMTDEAKDKHLKSTLYEGETPWPNVQKMNEDVDKLRHGPDFHLHEINVFDGRRRRVQYLVSRHIIKTIRHIFANPGFKKVFRASPERHWLSPRKNQRMFGDIYSANWWWKEQEKMQGKGKVTIAPLIIATDQTTLSIMCGGQKAYPVYLTIGNIEKSTRRKTSKRAMVLLGYLPIDAFEDVEDDNERRRLKADLVHRAMEKMMEPLREASENGVDMWCPDGRLRRVYPRIAAYMADWPEQNLQSCTSEGSCPVCTAKHGERGQCTETELRDREETLDALRGYFVHRDVGELRDLSLKPVWPWWGDLPDVNLATCLTPDLLHQVFQGVFKSHLVRWLKYLVGEDVLDERFAAMPQAEGMKHFSKGISGVQQWTGKESKEMLNQIFPVVLGDLPPEQTQLVRSIVDFMFRARASSMTDRDIDDLERDLKLFHELKGLLVTKGFYQDEGRFNRIPKLHMLGHYAHMIRELGTPDGYNTELPERLHIEYAKVPWRASNKVRPLPQMIRYIQRQEAILIHRAYLDRYLGLDEDEENEETMEVVGTNEEAVGDGGGDKGVVWPEDDSDDSEGDDGEGDHNQDEPVGPFPPEPITYPDPRRHIAINPTKRNLPIRDVAKHYRAPELTSAITNFMTNQLSIRRHDVLLSDRNHVHVWHRLYLHHRPLPFAPFDSPRRDVVRAGAVLPGRSGPVWDVALYLEQPNHPRSHGGDGEQKHGIHRYRAGRIRTIFTLPGHLQQYYSSHLAYVEVFEAFDTSVSPFGQMHWTKPDLDSRNRRRTLVVPITDIVMACHLVPKFHRLDKDIRLTVHTDAFAISDHFWLNHYYNRFFYQLLQHWRRRRPGILDRLWRHVRQSPTDS